MQTKQGTLTRQLDVFHSAMLQRLPDCDRRALGEAHIGLRARLGERQPFEGGDRAPDFTLPDQHGRPVALAEQLSQGSLIILFIRGGWCPFCSLTLRAYQAALPAFQQAGADVVAITPQPVSRCSAMAERDLLAFPMLSDQDNLVAQRYGVAYELPESIRPLFTRLGHDLPRLNETGNWRVPFPATFVVGAGGVIIASHVDPASHHRLDPEDALAVVRRNHLGPERSAQTR